MTKLILKCLAASLAILSPVATVAGISASSPMMASAESVSADITSSDPFHDLTLIYLGGDMSKFTGPKCFLRDDRPNDYFQVCGYRPWNEDLYIYLYFNNSSKLFPGFSASNNYYGNFTVYEKGNGNSVASQETSRYRLTEIGSRWKSGAQNSGGPYYFVKLKAEGIFPDASAGKAYDVVFSELGVMAGDSFVKHYDVEEEYSFNYDRDNYDITAKWWANNAVRLEGKGVVRMTKQHDGSYYSLIGMRNYVPVSGYFEDFFVFFNLDRTPSQILSVDFYYTEVTFFGSAVKSSRDDFVDPLNSSTYADYNVPFTADEVGFTYEVGNEIEVKYKDTEWATKTKQRFHTVKSDQTVIHRQTATSFLPPFTVNRKVETPEILNLSALDVQLTGESAADQKSWLSKQGSGYKYASLINGDEELICDWTDKLDKTERYYAPRFPQFWNYRTDYYYLYQAHAALNTYALRMVVKDEKGQDASWNVFNNAIEIVDHVGMATHSVTFDEWLVHVKKQFGDWLVPVILTAYSVVAALAAILLASAIMRAGRKKD